MISEIEITVRLLAACIFGGVIGWERERTFHPAGIRTRICITPFEIDLIGGLAQLISMQIEVGKVEQQSNLRALAEIRALQA